VAARSPPAATHAPQDCRDRRQLALVGGINIIDDHHHRAVEAQDLGPRYDYAVACEGPIVGPIAFAVERLWWTVQLLQRPVRDTRRPRFVGSGCRHRCRTTCAPRCCCATTCGTGARSRVLTWMRWIRRANEVIIAMAYFLPGRRLREALVAAAQRGVKVRLLLQGKVEYRAAALCAAGAVRPAAARRHRDPRVHREFPAREGGGGGRALGHGGLEQHRPLQPAVRT
jgi:phosphatidylserine/phosphatidylglycerophosphate/cardiolipin synthase-like enzyme